MRFGRLLPGLSVFVAASALIVLTGTGAAATEPGRSAPAATTANLSAPAALDSYLRSIGVSRASLVVQRGARNYAGPNCPGKSWNCTTSKRVLQIAKSDGQNKVDCTATTPGSIDPTGPSVSCVIFQTSANNSAKCQQRSNSSAAVQHCSITQTGAKNDAYVHQTVHAEDAAVQTATQTAVVTQNGGSNKSHVKQDVMQKAKDGSIQSQDAHQVAEIDQDASGSGDNFSNVDQDIHQSAKGSAATQTQNTAGLPTGLFDCAPAFPSSVFAPNSCANVSQTSDAGKNESRLKQSIMEDAKSKIVAWQQQGSSAGGIDGQVHQFTVSGSSSNRVNQDKRQKLSAPDGSFQQQYDPLSCCGFGSQDGGTGNHEDIHQSSTQDASDPDVQQSLLTGSTRSDGSCSVRQKASNNFDTGGNFFSSPAPCPPTLVTTTCVGTGGDNEEEEETPSGDCTEDQPPVECFEDEYEEGFFCGVFDLRANGVYNVRGPARQNR